MLENRVSGQQKILPAYFFSQVITLKRILFLYLQFDFFFLLDYSFLRTDFALFAAI